jgi:long-subunit fatty acid transport protein
MDRKFTVANSLPRALRHALLNGTLSTLISVSAQATTGAGHTGLIAKSDNAVNANLNPAGLVRIERPEWVGQSLYFNSTSNYKYTSDAGPGEFRNNSDGSTVVPFVYYARPLTNKIGLGVHVTGNAFGTDLGDGKTEIAVRPTGETIKGKYDDHYAIGLDFTVRWIR